MEFKSLAELVQYVDKAFAIKFYSGASVLRKGALKIIASVVGGALYMLMLLAKRIWKNSFVSTCGPEALDGFGTEYGLPHKAPTYAMGTIFVYLTSGTESATVPADTYFVDPVTKLEYKSIVGTTINANNKEVSVIAVKPGAEYNTAASVDLAFRDSTPSGLKDECEVNMVGLRGGFAVEVVIEGNAEQWGETVDEYRTRLLTRVQNQPNGGSLNDYRQWAERFDFVSRAYPIAGNPHSNSVAVCLANYNTSDIKPTTAQINEVKTYIMADCRRPINADVNVFGVTAVNFTVSAMIDPCNAAVKDSAKAAVQKFFSNIEPGKTKLFDDLRTYVLANSIAKNFVIDSVKKAGSSVSNISMSFNPSSSVAQVGKVTADFYGG